MKTSMLMKTVAALACGIFAGTALAGPGDAYLGFPAASFAKASAEKKTEYVTIALPLGRFLAQVPRSLPSVKSG